MVLAGRYRLVRSRCLQHGPTGTLAARKRRRGDRRRAASSTRRLATAVPDRTGHSSYALTIDDPPIPGRHQLRSAAELARCSPRLDVVRLQTHGLADAGGVTAAELFEELPSAPLRPTSSERVETAAILRHCLLPAVAGDCDRLGLGLEVLAEDD
jgi:hypothetical protein